MDGVSEYKTNPAKHAARAKAWRASNPTTKANWLARILHTVRYRAKRRGLAFDITVSDVHVPERCPVFGIPLVFGAARNSEDSPSLDRINPRFGYVKGNVAVISQRANTIKNNASSAELKLVAAWVEGQGY
jgi:hypothetical protein